MSRSPRSENGSSSAPTDAAGDRPESKLVWQPYCNGNWQRTDAGWYWVSDEPWAWATYHLSLEFHRPIWLVLGAADAMGPSLGVLVRRGGCIGWSPLYPSDVRVISPRAYVFVEERHFMEPG